MVAVATEHILAGDIFQVVLSQRFDLDLDAEPFDMYRSLRQVNPSPYMYFIRHPEVTVVGSSPEPMVQLLDGRVISRPIAGTRRRGRTEADERRMAAELTEDPKERAEHVMLVDLARNDVGRVGVFGTEKVDEFFTLERYSHVMHLTSQVSADLRDGLGPIDVLRATLPAGTVSGAPKVRAMQIIDELEPTRRGPYAGVVGYVDFTGQLDTAIAIRTMFIAPDGRAIVQAGAGIVVDSDPASEDLECANKAAALLAAVPAARRMTARRDARVIMNCVSAHVDIVLVEGAEATSYLQGQLSQDVESLAVGNESWSFVLAPNGHIDGFVLMRRTGDDSFEFEIDPGFGEPLEARLRRFLLRTKATITLAPAEIVASDDSAEVERIRAGRPSMGKDIDERSVPAEIGWLDRGGVVHQGVLRRPGTRGSHGQPCRRAAASSRASRRRRGRHRRRRGRGRRCRSGRGDKRRASRWRRACARLRQARH